MFNMNIPNFAYAILAFILSVFVAYNVGLSKGSKRAQDEIQAQAFNEIRGILDDQRKTINKTNEATLVLLDRSIEFSQQRQQIVLDSFATKSDIAQFFKDNHDLYKDCVLPKEQLEKLNREIRK